MNKLMIEAVVIFALAGCCVAFGYFLRAKCRRRRKPARFEWTVGPVQPKEKGNAVTEIKITNEQKVRVALAPKTATGKPAPLDGKPTWVVSSGDSTVVVAEDGLSAELVSSDTPGETIVVVEADADLGEGVVTITDAIKLTVEGALATSLGLSVGEPEAKA